jgi:hypothetical protein
MGPEPPLSLDTKFLLFFLCRLPLASPALSVLCFWRAWLILPMCLLAASLLASRAKSLIG